MRAILIFTLYFCFQLDLAAQGTIMVLHVAGQAQYLPHYGAKPIPLAPGDELEIKGKIRCKGSSTVRLIYDGVPISVSGTKMRDLSEIVRTASQQSQMTFTGRFFSFLNESVKEGVTDEKLKKHHRRYMNKSSGGIKGFASPDVTIKALLVATGKLPQANVIFKWRSIKGDGPYVFSIMNQNQKTVAQLLLKDTAVTLDLDQLYITLDEEYTWSVTRGEKDRSAQIPFEVCPAQDLNTEKELSHDSGFVKANQDEQQMMIAYQLEEDHSFYAAQKIYQRLLEKSPDNAIYKRIYASFLARRDMLPEAEKLISNKQ
ncbi:MAG: hypothetical protein JNN28_18100 [Saprospiraceae bacterium]|nr:hypothetical protein [Saprospiraceae bacterium]